MGKVKLKGKDLKSIGYQSNQTISLAIDIISKHYKYFKKEEQLALLSNIKNDYKAYLDNDVLGMLALHFDDTPVLKERKEIQHLRATGEFNVYGRKQISSNAYQQMEMVMRLPIAEKGALMPDAHQGYGLPIGGVLATKNEVIPYGVGMDIGCRMALSIYDIKPEFLSRYSYQLKTALKERTNFGTGGELKIAQEHEVLDNHRFQETALLRQLHGKAVKQLGTSGSGNHFVEFGIVELVEDNGFGLAAGQYVGLLSHSGSRGFGATIAKYYSDKAFEMSTLPREVRHLSWLDMNTELGQEYWLSMNLAGDYAKACHDQIHHHLSKYMGIKAVTKVENHHNFAWKEIQPDGQELIVHRKGATPAAKGELGVIPGSMTAAGYIVRGRGESRSLFSASHGAGRKMSRKNARESYTNSAMKKVLSSNGVTLIGGGVDEAPIAYKDIHQVMNAQQDLVDVLGTFIPKIVRMDKG